MLVRILERYVSGLGAYVSILAHTRALYVSGVGAYVSILVRILERYMCRV
jgi:hypothetical protein